MVLNTFTFGLRLKCDCKKKYKVFEKCIKKILKKNS